MFVVSRSLTFREAELPSGEVRKIVASGEFGKEITPSDLRSPISAIQTMMRSPFSFQKLREMTLGSVTRSERSRSIFPGETRHGQPLRSLRLSYLREDSIPPLGTYILLFDLIRKLIVLSSHMCWRSRVVWGAFRDFPTNRVHPRITNWRTAGSQFSFLL